MCVGWPIHFRGSWAGGSRSGGFKEMSSVLADQVRGGGGGVAGSHPMSTHGAQINFGYPTPYLPYDFDVYI